MTDRFFARVLCLAVCALVAGCNGTSPTNQSPLVPLLPTAAPLPPVETDFDVSGRDIDIQDVSTTPVSAFTHAVAVHAIAGPDAASGRRLKFFIHGMDYSPTPPGRGVNNNPLGSSNSAVWTRDFAQMRALGVNVIHVYNVNPADQASPGAIDNALKALWNGGNKPIYVVYSIHFGASCLLNSGCANDLAGQYYKLDKQYATNPAVLGVAISNEINPCKSSDPNCTIPSNATYWGNFNTIATQAKQGFRDGGNANKLVLTSNVDDNNYTLSQGKQFNAAVDAWGINVYRGRGFTDFFTQVQSTTNKPVVVTEYGGTAGWHPKGSANMKYVYPVGGNGVCQFATGPYAGKPVNGPPPPTPVPDYAPTDVAEMPAAGNVSFKGLNDLVTNSNQQLYSAWTGSGAVSGGFYFEWNDEWWKADQPSNASKKHLGNGNVVNSYPACARDEAWYGLNAISAAGTLTPRSTLNTLKTVWASQKTTQP